MEKQFYQVYCLDLSREYTDSRYYIGAESEEELRKYLLTANKAELSYKLMVLLHDEHKEKLKNKKSKIVYPVEHFFSDKKLELVLHFCY